MTTRTAPLYVKPAPEGLFPDRPGACFVIHRSSGRRMPATWPAEQQAADFIAALDLNDWNSPHTTMDKGVWAAIETHGGHRDGLDGPYLPQPAYLPTHAEVAELLDRADNVLETNGFWHGDASNFHDPDQEDQGLPPEQCRVCLLGAIHIAADGHPEHPENTRALILANTAANALSKTLGVDDVTRWNDAADLDAVRAAITRTAARLRENPAAQVAPEDTYDADDKAWKAMAC